MVGLPGAVQDHLPAHGTLTQAGLKGTINHSSGLTFTHSGKTATATNFVLAEIPLQRVWTLLPDQG
jgi:hypothetical protein